MSGKGRVIVTYGRSWQALAIVRSLGRKGIDVIVGEEAPFAPCFFSRYCTSSFRHPSVTSDPEGFIDALLKVVKENKPEDPDEPYVLIPVHKETWLLAQHRERFDPHIKMALTSFENMQLVHNKGNIARLARESDVTTPDTWHFSSVDEVYRAVPDMRFPAFVKMRESAAGVGIAKVDDAEELVAAYRRFVDGHELKPEEYPIVQAGVPGDDYCVTTLFDHGTCVAKMTYRNIRAFPRETGAGALRETVRLPEAEEAAVKLLAPLGWHGIAELDFRKADDGPAWLIEVNPRLFGGLPQAVAANVDYPHLLFRIAAGEKVEPVSEVDYDARTESPITGLLATLDEIARDPERIERLRLLRDEARLLAHTDVLDLDTRPFFDALVSAVNPADIRQTIQEKLEAHQGTVDDVLQSDDPLPALGFLYPIALMLQHGKLSVALIAGEEEVEEATPRRRLRDMLFKPTWLVLAVTALVFGACTLLMHWGPTADNLGFWLAWPHRLAERLMGEIGDPATLKGALRTVGYYALNFIFYYLVAALILRQTPPLPQLRKPAPDRGRS